VLSWFNNQKNIYLIREGTAFCYESLSVPYWMLLWFATFLEHGLILIDIIRNDFQNLKSSLWKRVNQCRNRTIVEPMPGVNNSAHTTISVKEDHVSFTTGSTTLFIHSVVGAVSAKVNSFRLLSKFSVIYWLC